MLEIVMLETLFWLHSIIIEQVFSEVAPGTMTAHGMSRK
jgi:hypothetical protein